VSLLRKRRGVSGIISGVFLVAVAVMVFNVLAWQFFQADAYNRLEQERQQREWERINERLAILTVETGVSKLNFTVRNYGSVTAHIVTLYFVFSNGTRYVYSLDTWIAAGTTRRIANVGPTLTANDVYDFQIATARGNLVAPTQITSNEMEPGESQKMPFTFGFGYNDFQYRRVGYADWLPAWRIPNSYNVHFRISLKNTYPYSVTLVSIHTRLTFMPDPWAQQAPMGSKLGSDLTIPPNTEQWVYFIQDTVNFPNKKDVHYFVYVEIFYYLDAADEIRGTNVALLAVYTI